jgi:hypothetical protein
MMHYAEEEVRTMRFSTLIGQISRDLPVKIVRSDDLYEISDVALLDGVQSEFTNTTLYFGFPAQLPGGALPAQCVLADEDGAPAAETGCLALVLKDSLFFLFNAARRRIDEDRGRGLYAEMLDMAAGGAGIDTLVNLAASRLGNSVVLLGADYRVLSHSTIFPISDPLWAENIRRGYCSYEFISAVEDMDAVKNAPYTSEPMVVTCSASPLRKLSSRFFLDGRIAGCVLMIEKETPISPVQMELLPVAAAAIGSAVSRYLPYLVSDATAYQKLLYDLLIGATPEQLAPRLAELRFSPRLAALCIRQTRALGQKRLRENVAPKLAEALPGTRCVFHENGVAALIPLGEAPGLPDETRAALAALAKEESLRIGVSNLFFTPGHFARCYAQARRALELCSRLAPDETVCLYAGCSFYDLLSAADGGSLGLYCHPALSILSRYDRDSGANLYRTLETYLACSCSVKKTAEQLFIHRNSLDYRLLRIRELTGLDLGDSNVVFQLAMSYRIDRFTGLN